MKGGFIIDTSLCVDCRACVAACLIENRWEGLTRSVLTTNPAGNPGIPVINLSLACNHCKTAACLNSCPAKAYSRPAPDGPVIIDGEKCIGCGYCTWNCPYGAPVPGNKGYIEKCHLCNHRLIENNSPACTNACPTGALAFGPILTESSSRPEWFPETDLEPQIRFSENKLPQNPAVIPEESNVCHRVNDKPEKSPGIVHWSLVVFTTIIPVAVAISVKNYLSGSSEGVLLTFLLSILGGGLSLFHLTRPQKAYRALLNLRSSALSKEIGMLLLFTLTTALAAVTGMEIFYGLSALTGLMLLWFVDNVYSSVDTGKNSSYRSGQTFLAGLMTGAFLLERNLAFGFVAILRVIFSLIHLRKANTKIKILSISRILLLLPAFIYLAGLADVPKSVAFGAIIAGELADRLKYYFELKVLNVNNELVTYSIRNEKKRDK